LIVFGFPPANSEFLYGEKGFWRGVVLASPGRAVGLVATNGLSFSSFTLAFQVFKIK